MSRVGIVGPGRVGTLLAVACARAGMRVTTVAGGTAQARDAVVRHVAGVRPLASVGDAAAAVDLLLLAVPDDALEQVATDLVLADAVREGLRVVHVAGSRGPDVLTRVTAAGGRVAACHPAMTVPAGSTDPDVLVGVTWAVTAASTDRAWARSLVHDLGGDPVEVAADRRALYHAGLSVGSNAVAAAVAVARQLLLAAGIEQPAGFLGPLAHASVGNVVTRGASAITGPVARGDLGTLDAHLRAIDDDVPGLSAVYRHLASATLGPLRTQLPADVVDALDQALAVPTPEV